MDLGGIAVFVEALKSGSLAKAAGRLGLTAMSATRALAALEKELGVRLVHRTTRSLSSTAEGDLFLPHARAMLEARDNGLEAIRPRGAGVSGLLRITASAAFGRKVVAPMIPGFMDGNPDLQVDLMFTDEQVDIVARGIDIAIRIAKLRDNRLVARKLADNPRRLCASPAYIARHGAPTTLAELDHHACLVASGTSHWTFRKGSRSVQHRVSGRLTANSIEALHASCVAGQGIANLSSWDVDEEIRAGRLAELVLIDAAPEALAIWAVFPSSRQIPAKARAFIAALRTVLNERLAGLVEPGKDLPPEALPQG